LEAEGSRCKFQDKTKIDDIFFIESLNLVNVVINIHKREFDFQLRSTRHPAPLAWAIEAELERSIGLSMQAMLRDTDRFQWIISNEHS